MKLNITFFAALAMLCAVRPLLAAPTNPAPSTLEYSHAVQYELGDGEFAPGDSITIQELRGTSEAVQPGGTYCVTGTYTLKSQTEADLSFFATTTNHVSTFIDPQQTMRIKQGTGAFHLVKQMTDSGYLHLTFYSRVTGQGFGGVYFGQGQWVLHDKHFSYHKAATRAEKTESFAPVSATDANQVLYTYLGDPVAPPPDLDAAYTRLGLTHAVQKAAKNTGISLVKLEIDDSEFPFLVGVNCATKGDLEKLEEQLRKLVAYNFNGGVDSQTSYAMNLIPANVFPNDASQRIYHRMMLREAVFYDKINGRE